MVSVPAKLRGVVSSAYQLGALFWQPLHFHGLRDSFQCADTSGVCAWGGFGASMPSPCSACPEIQLSGYQMLGSQKLV